MPRRVGRGGAGTLQHGNGTFDHAAAPLRSLEAVQGASLARLPARRPRHPVEALQALPLAVPPWEQLQASREQCRSLKAPGEHSVGCAGDSRARPRDGQGVPAVLVAISRQPASRRQTCRAPPPPPGRALPPSAEDLRCLCCSPYALIPVTATQPVEGMIGGPKLTLSPTEQLPTRCPSIVRVFSPNPRCTMLVAAAATEPSGSRFWRRDSQAGPRRKPGGVRSPPPGPSCPPPAPSCQRWCSNLTSSAWWRGWTGCCGLRRSACALLALPSRWHGAH